jgi:hypothetical protein
LPVACNAILDRAFGKPGPPKEEKDDIKARFANMTREERLAEMQRLLEPMQQYLPARPKTTAAIITVSEMSSGDPRRPRRTWHQWVPRPVSPVPGVHADPRGTRPNRRAGRGFDPGFSYKISIRNSCDFSRGVNVSLYGVVHCRDAAVPHMVPLWVSPVPIPLNPSSARRIP